MDYFISKFNHFHFVLWYLSLISSSWIQLLNNPAEFLETRTLCHHVWKIVVFVLCWMFSFRMVLSKLFRILTFYDISYLTGLYSTCILTIDCLDIELSGESDFPLEFLGKFSVGLQVFVLFPNLILNYFSCWYLMWKLADARTNAFRKHRAISYPFVVQHNCVTWFISIITIVIVFETITQYCILMPLKL